VIQQPVHPQRGGGGEELLAMVDAARERVWLVVKAQVVPGGEGEGGERGRVGVGSASGL
jgi:hypothetical protein